MIRTVSSLVRASTCIAMLLIGCQSMAGPVHALFGREILGIPWTATRTELVMALPGGTWTGPRARTYTVMEGSTVFGIRRTARQSIVVAMNEAGKMASVAIKFPNGTGTHLDLLENLTHYLGEPAGADTTVTRDSAGRANVRTTWEDGGLQVTLVHSIVTATFTSNEVSISRTSTLP